MSTKYDYARFSKQEVEAVFGPKSNSLEAARLAKNDPEKYTALKQSGAYIHGIIAPAMLPRSSQLTREQLDAKARADAAAQRDDLIALPDALADRMGVERGFKVSFENLEKLMGRRDS